MPEPTKNHEKRGLGSRVPTARCGFILALLLSPCLASSARASSWWDGEWTLRKEITIDTGSTGASISEALGPVPVLLRLHDGDFQFGAAKADGTDIRFLDSDDKTLLSYHIEKFDPVLDEAFVWVNVPSLKPGAKTSIWLYYGNASDKAVKVEDAKATYDSGTVLVYHFNEHGQPSYDFTGQGNNALNTGVAADGSMVGTGLRLDGRTSVGIPGSSGLAWSEGGTMTWSAWVKFGPPVAQGILFSRKENSNSLVIGADGGVPFVSVTSGGSTARSTAGAPMGASSWHHLAVVASGSRVDLYVDGAPYGSAAMGLPALDSPSVLGGDGSTVGGNGFVGEIDELEISKVARTPGFISFLALEQGADSSSKVVSLGADEQPSSWLSFLKKGYIGVIIGSLTPDGWAVIALLAVMSLISWLVMISKAIYLSRIAKGNQEFLKEWGAVASDLSVLDHFADAPSEGETKAASAAKPTVRIRRNAPLYRVYHMGIVEVQHRMSEDREGRTVAPFGPRVLSARSIQAIRASLDAALTRESHKLNDKMVLLTIAISGGPFLGLLGTVVGVMITFAAVAQAGDVNVNAIAPGIAAALAATVAGLGVAIPALFGYNYLLTKIKGASTDMHVFVDEFVTKMAEYYSQGEA
jgi:biopolymer transport protein ExbB